MIEENKSSMKNSVRRLVIAGIAPDYLGSGAGNAFKSVFTNYHIINSSY